jgi:hypothetical protein
MRVGLRSLSLTQRRVGAGAAPPSTDLLKDQLDALDAASKVICAWFLPNANPTQYLTLNGSTQVTAWAASHGSAKLTLTEATNPPPYDATAFGNKGGLTLNGSTNKLRSTGPFTGWPAATDSFYGIAGARNDTPGATTGVLRIFDYGASLTDDRGFGRTSATSVNRIVSRMNGAGAAGTLVDLAGAHTIGVFFNSGASKNYADSTNDGNPSTAYSTLTQTAVCVGADPSGTAQFWNGAVSCVALLNNTASLADFLNLQAAMASRLS